MCGGVWARARAWASSGYHDTEKHTQFKHEEIYFRPRLSCFKKLHAEQELDNAVDKCAVKVVKNNETVGNLPYEYSRILWYLSHVAERHAWKWLTVDVTSNRCAEEWRFLIAVRVKWKLIAWKNSWRVWSAYKNSKTQTAPLGTTTHENVNEQQQHALSFFYDYFLTF